MNWDAIGAIGEITGALAVIGSIMYLAVQIRQNTLSNRITAKQNTTDHFTSFGMMMLEYPGSRHWWREQDKRRVTRPFYELVEAEIREIEAST